MTILENPQNKCGFSKKKQHLRANLDPISAIQGERSLLARRIIVNSAVKTSAWPDFRVDATESACSDVYTLHKSYTL